MKKEIKNSYELEINEDKNLKFAKPNLRILFCLDEFEISELKIRKIDKKFHTFIHWYDESFKKLYESKINFTEFLKLKNKNDNNSILYTGIENKIKEKYINKINKYKNNYADAFLTKIMIKGERGLRLLSIIGYKSNDKKETINEIIFHIYPITIENFHN